MLTATSPAYAKLRYPLLGLLICLFCIPTPTLTQAIMRIGLLLVAAYLLFCNTKTETSSQRFIQALIVAGLILRIGYMLYTTAFIRGHDLGEASIDGRGHASYILILLDSHKLPQDYRTQHYQQPFYYVVAAAVSWVLNTLRGTADDPRQLIEGAKPVSCFASCAVLLMLPALCKELKLPDKAVPIAVAVIAFFPNFFLLAGRVGPDALSILLMMLAFLYTLRWFRTPTWKLTILLALLYGLAISTKISCAVFAVFTGILMLVRLVRAKRQKQAGPLVCKLCVFGAISLPLGMWYSIRNLVRFGQPIGYVLRMSESSDLYCGDRSFVHRFLSFSFKELFRTPYGNAFKDSNYPLYLLKTSMFGEFRYDISPVIPSMLLFVNILLATATVASLFYVIGWSKLPRLTRFGMTGLWILLYLSSISFNITYPFGCTMDFRYIVPTAVFGAICLGIAYADSCACTAGGRKQKLASCVRIGLPILITCFAFLSAFMYTLI